MITVPEAAIQAGKNPETIRRWIREGRLRAHKIGTQHVIEERDLQEIIRGERLPVPGWWPTRTASGMPIPDGVAVVKQQRGEH